MRPKGNEDVEPGTSPSLACLGPQDVLMVKAVQ